MKKLFSASGAVGFLIVSGMVLILMILSFVDLNQANVAHKQFNAAMAPIIAIR